MDAAGLLGPPCRRRPRGNRRHPAGTASAAGGAPHRAGRDGAQGDLLRRGTPRPGGDPVPSEQPQPQGLGSGGPGAGRGGHSHPDPRPPGLRRQRWNALRNARAPGDQPGPRPVAGRHRAGLALPGLPARGRRQADRARGRRVHRGGQRRAGRAPSSRRGAVAGAALGRDLPPRLAVPEGGRRPSGALRGVRRRRVPADGRGDGAAVPVPGQPGEGAGPLPGEEGALAGARARRQRAGPRHRRTRDRSLQAARRASRGDRRLVRHHPDHHPRASVSRHPGLVGDPARDRDSRWRGACPGAARPGPAEGSRRAALSRGRGEHRRQRPSPGERAGCRGGDRRAQPPRPSGLGGRALRPGRRVPGERTAGPCSEACGDDAVAPRRPHRSGLVLVGHRAAPRADPGGRPAGPRQAARPGRWSARLLPGRGPAPGRLRSAHAVRRARSRDSAGSRSRSSRQRRRCPRTGSTSLRSS